MSLQPETMVIIGGTSGIGLATAQRGAALGLRVVVVGRDRGRLDAALDQLGPPAIGHAADAGSAHELIELFRSLGRIDHLVLCASGSRGAGPLAVLDPEDLRGGFEAKFWVQWIALHTALPFLSPNASVTFVTAASARVGNPGTSGLAAINGALNAMVLPLARELAPIRVNAVSPGVIDTAWWDARPPEVKETFFDAAARSTPAARVGRPEEVADAIMYLAQAGFTTGVILDVDGGLRTSSV